MADQSLSYQKYMLEEFLSQWEYAMECENNTNVNEDHISLDMNLDSLNGKWLYPTYKYFSLARLVQIFLIMETCLS